MQRDDEKKWSIWQLLFPLLLSLCILILRYRLKSSLMSNLATTQVESTRLENMREQSLEEVANEHEVQEAGRMEETADEVKLITDSDVPFSEEVIAVTQDDGLVATAEHESVVENEDVDKDEETGLMVEAYCVKCRQKRVMENPQEIETKNGRHALEGMCPVCGTRLFRFIAG